MTGTVTVTATTGPGITVTAQTYTNISNVQFDFNAGCLYLNQNSELLQFSLEGVTTVTVSISGSTYTFTVS